MIGSRAVSAAAVLLLAGPAAAEPYELSDCPEVVVALEDPVEPNGTIGPEVAELACEKLRRLAPRFGVELTGRPMVRLMIADDAQTFHAHTGRGRMTQAIYSQRTGIITQPAKQIRRMHRIGRLGGLLAHELTHYLIDHQAGPHCPTWLHEGLAQHFEGRRPMGRGPTTSSELAALEVNWRLRGDPARTAWCYRQSLALVKRLLAATGEQKLLAALPELETAPHPLALRVGDRSLHRWLFPDEPPPRRAQRDRAEGRIEIQRGPARPAEEEQLTPLPLDQMLEQGRGGKPAGGEAPAARPDGDAAR
jgi:hypothetical protein